MVLVDEFNDLLIIYRYMPKFSIIVPVYNSSQYISRCVDSIIAQSVQDFELILVDDGSTDASGAMCDSYAEVDPRIRVFHKENGGVSSARNMGIDNALGEYITFIDSDDWVEHYYLEDFLPIADYDFISNYYVVDGWDEWVSCPLNNCEYDTKNFICFLNGDFNKINNMTSRLFRREIIETNNIRFNTKISYSEDVLFIYTFIACSRTIKTIGNPVYHYIRQDSGTLSHSLISWSTYNLIINELCDIISKLEKKYHWDGIYIRSMVVRNHFNKFIREIQWGYKIKPGIEALRESIKNPYVYDHVLDNKTYLKSRARRILDILVQCRLYGLCVILLKLTFKG